MVDPIAPTIGNPPGAATLQQDVAAADAAVAAVDTAFPVNAWMLSGASLATGLAGAYANYQAGQLQASQARFQAAMAEIAARDARFRGQQRLAAMGSEVAGLMGAQRAMLSGGAGAVDTGTAAELVADAQYWATIDRVTEQNNIYREAFGLRQTADMARVSADATESAGAINAASTIVGSANQAGLLLYGGTRNA